MLFMLRMKRCFVIFKGITFRSYKQNCIFNSHKNVRDVSHLPTSVPCKKNKNYIFVCSLILKQIPTHIKYPFHVININYLKSTQNNINYFKKYSKNINFCKIMQFYFIFLTEGQGLLFGYEIQLIFPSRKQSKKGQQNPINLPESAPSGKVQSKL